MLQHLQGWRAVGRGEVGEVSVLGEIAAGRCCSGPLARAGCTAAALRFHILPATAREGEHWHGQIFSVRMIGYISLQFNFLDETLLPD